MHSALKMSPPKAQGRSHTVQDMISLHKDRAIRLGEIGLHCQFPRPQDIFRPQAIFDAVSYGFVLCFLSRATKRAGHFDPSLGLSPKTSQIRVQRETLEL